MMKSKIFNLLKEEALKSDFIKHRHAACLIYKGKIISIGINRRKSHPLQKKFQTRPSRIYLHAEIDAIIKAINKHGTSILKDCELNVLRLTKAGKVGNSKPCLGCTKAIKAFGITKVNWTH